MSSSVFPAKTPPESVEGLVRSCAGRVATVHFAFTTMSRPFLVWFSRVLSELEGDSKIEAVILTGVKSVFMTGADLPEVRALATSGAAQDFLGVPHQLMKRVYHLDKLTLAAINGHCVGGGLELALACDFRVAANDLRGADGAELDFLSLPETRLGLVPALAGTWLLESTVGRRHAAQLLYSGAAISASSAFAIRLVDEIAPRHALLDVAKDKVLELLENPSVAMRSVKRLMRGGDGFDEALARSATEFATCCESGDKNERIDRIRAERVRSFRSASEVQ